MGGAGGKGGGALSVFGCVGRNSSRKGGPDTLKPPFVTPFGGRPTIGGCVFILPSAPIAWLWCENRTGT